MGTLNLYEEKVRTSFYLILFVQCVPGFEEDICQQLTNFFGDKPSQFYYAFSEFDIVMLVQLGNDKALELPITFSHPKIRDFQQVICYSLYDIGDHFAGNSALTITLLKFNEFETTSKGIGIEKAAYDLLKPIADQTKEKAVESLLLGTLGWPEVIYIQTGNNLRHLLDPLSQVAARGLEYCNLQISHTIPCVKRISTGVARQISMAPVLGDVENWRISVSCYPHMIFRLGQEIRNRFPKLVQVLTYGRRDLLILPNLDSLVGIHEVQVILDVLTTLGSDLSSFIISTHTDLGITVDIDLYSNYVDTHSSLSQDRNKREETIKEGFNKLNQRIQQFAVWEGKRKNLTLKQSSQLYQVVSRLQAISATPGLEGVVDDMLEFVKATVRKAHSQVRRIPPVLVDEDNRRKYLELEDMENLYLFGLEQRIAGGRLGLGHASQAYSNLQGLGIQRILRAARAVPYGLLRGLNPIVAERWWGFTVFGYRNDTFTLPSGVINLPYQDMLHPEDWWRLGHESGHAFGMITELLDNPILRDSLDRVDKNILRDTLGREKEQIIDELAVGIFEYLYCYRGNFSLYLKNTWRFFDDLLEGVHDLHRVKEYLLRSVFVYFFHLEINNALKPREKVTDLISRGKLQETLFEGDISRTLRGRAFSEADSIENIISYAILDKIDNEDVAKRISFLLRQINLADIAMAYEAIENFRSDFADLFEYYQERFLDPEKHLKRYLIANLEMELINYGSILEEGRIITDLKEDIDVFLIPLALQYRKNDQKKEVSQRARIAAILSLWHLDRQWHGYQESTSQVID